MKASFFAAVGLASVACAQSVGSAIVVNGCNYEVYLANTPSADGGFQEIDAVLTANGGTYSQVYTQLTNGNGWSLKLSPTESLENIMQYEYTFHNDGTIWYDLSDVNGNPWDGNWEITSKSSTCVPKQAAYRFSTDDAYGMQACPQDSVIQVELCSGDKGAVASAAVSVAVPTTSIAPDVTLGSSSALPTTTLPGAAFAEESSTMPTTSATPTTLATMVAAASSSVTTTAAAAPNVATLVAEASGGGGDFSDEVVSMSAAASPTAAPSPSVREWRHAHRHAERHRRRSHHHG